MSSTSIATSQRELFGGAITTSLPSNVIDASEIRQVPDTQEVFLSRDSDISHVVEILEAVEVGKSDEDAVRFHFSSLAHDNDAQDSSVLEISKVGSAVTLSGVQKVRKFNKPEEPLDTVLIHLAVWRLAPRKDIDLVMSCNEPLSDGAEKGSQEVSDAFRTAVETLDIRDWSLFA